MAYHATANFREQNSDKMKDLLPANYKAKMTEESV
jgi:hypothetical protein